MTAPIVPIAHNLDSTYMNSALTVQFRNHINPRTMSFSVLADAVAFGLRDGEAFDVSSASGAIVWAWEMRP